MSLWITLVKFTSFNGFIIVKIKVKSYTFELMKEIVK